MAIERLFSAREAAAILGISHRTIYVRWWRKKYGLRAQRVGKHLKFRESELQRFLDEQTEETIENSRAATIRDRAL